MDFMSRQLVCLDSYHRIHTYGRTCTDCAAIGLPLVGTKLQYLQNSLFPKLCTEPYDIFEQQNLLDKLLDDKSFYQEVVEYGYQKSEDYGFKASSDRFLQAISKELPSRANNLID